MKSNKSPIKKISHAATAATRQTTKLASVAAHRGSQFLDQASSVVQNGTKLSSAVVASTSSPVLAYRGNGGGRGAGRHNHHHPQHHDSDGMEIESPISSSTSYATSFLDKISKFDAVAAGKSPYTSKNVTGVPSPSVHGSVTRRHRVVKRVEVEEPSPSSLREIEKENAEPSGNRSHHFGAKTNIARHLLSKLSPEVERNRHSSTTKHRSPKKEELMPNEVNKCDENNAARTKLLEKRLKQLEKENRTLKKTNASLENKCEQLIQEKSHLEREMINLNNNKAGYIKTKYDGVTSKKEPTQNNSTHGMNNRKQNIDEHPLIQSPLRKHVRAVNEASESNSVVTMKKEPFPLLLPSEQLQQHRLTVQQSQGSSEDGGVSYTHLDTLGALTHNENVDCKKWNPMPSAGGCNQVKTNVEKGGRDKKSEDAMDLINSAAFLFQNSSRRKLH